MKHLFLKNKKYLLCFLLFIAIINGIFASSDSSSKKVRIGYYENELFQEGAGENQVKKGYAYEYYRKLSEYTGWDYEYVYGSFIDLYTMLERGKIDLLAGVAYTKERARNIFYEQNPMGLTRYYLLKKNSDYDISTNPQTLNGKTIGVLNSVMVDILNKWLLENHITAIVAVYNDNQSLLEAFDKRTVDTVLVEGSGTYGRLDSYAFLCVGSTDYYLCVNKDRPDILEQLNLACSQLNNDYPNFVSSLYNKYYSTSVSNQAFSEEELKYIETHNELIIGYLDNYLPYCDTDIDGNVTGFLKDIVPAQFWKLGIADKIKFNYKSYDNYSLMINDLKENKIDVAFPVGGGLYFSEIGGFYQSQAVINTSIALIYEGDYLKNHNSVFAVNKNNDMQLYYVKTNYPDAEIKFYNSINNCLNAIKNGEADYTTINGLRVNNILKNSPYKKLKYRLLFQSDERCFGVKIGNENLLRILNRGINGLGEQFILNQAYTYSEELFHYTIGDYALNVVYILIPIVLIAGLIFLVYNINTKKKLRILNIKLESALENRERYIADMIRYASSGADSDKILNQLVEYIGKNTNSDRVYVFEENKNHGFDNTYEWCKEGITAEIQKLQDVPYEGVLELWMNEFKKHGRVIIEDIDAYVDISRTIYKILKAQNIKTLAAIPLKVKGRIVGFLGVDNPPVSEINNISEFLNLVEFFFSFMIRIRNGVKSISEIALHDQLSGFYNRRAYNDAINEYKEKGWDDHFVYVSIDINGLKVANDSISHEAGDELIKGACECMEQCLGPYGRLFRTGGDEFIAIIDADEKQLKSIKEDFQNVCENWSGNLIKELSLACGYVPAKEYPELSLHEIVLLADKLMYDEKTAHYKKRGVDRRGQKNAHIALCALYTKILKINLDEDSYQIINMDESEHNVENGFADKISDWFTNFGQTGHVHPEDLQEYLEKTNLDYLKSYFENGNKSLRIYYRRKYENEYKKVMMELIPANDYSIDNMNLFLYVKNID